VVSNILVFGLYGLENVKLVGYKFMRRKKSKNDKVITYQNKLLFISNSKARSFHD